jgi:hypothetical protein
VAVAAFEQLSRLGFAPLCPHLSHYAEEVHNVRFSHAEWIELDLEWVEASEAVYRLRGDSDGADQEVAHAEKCGIPVMHTVCSLEAWRDNEWCRKPKHTIDIKHSPASKHCPTVGTIEYSTGAVRSGDAETAAYYLLPPVGLRRIAETCREGAQKYSPYNWEKGMPVVDLIEHGLQHQYKYLDGDRTEDHLGHAGWNIMAAMHSEERWPQINKGSLRPVRIGNCIHNPNEYANGT